jgi:5'-nucleotidase
MRILLTNDDGINAPGLAALYRAAKQFGDVFVVAPSKVRSACSHAVTFHRPLRAWPAPVRDESGEELCEGMAVDGVPADCVKVGLARVVPQPVDLVLSGINAGCNVGVHIIYSGTVAAAREGAIAGVPAVAMSLFLARREGIAWDRASELAADCLGMILAEPLAEGLLLNVNLPILDDGAEPKGLVVAPAATSAMVDDYQGGHDDEGRLELSVSNQVDFRDKAPGTDVHALFRRYITVTPLKYDPTDHQALDQWRNRLK